jgi:YD repeat-containing protein
MSVNADPLGRTVTFTVDALGRLTATTDPQGSTVLRQYDSNGWLTRQTDAQGQATQFAYDHEGHLTRVTLPNTGVIATTYTPRYWVDTRTDALGQVEHWTYDGLGNVLTQTDRKGQVTTYAPRDALDRFTGLTYADGSTVTATTYDAGNRLLKLTDSVSGAIAYSYDALDRLTGESSPAGTVTYTYDAAGRRTAMTAAQQAPVTYTYDAANRLTSLSQGSERVGFAYDAANRRTTLTLPDGIAATYGYDAANELTSLGYAQAGGTSLGTLTYGYDSEGRRTSEGGTWASTVPPTPTTQAATFDLGNRETSFNGQALSYDADGNLTGDGTDTYVWNARGQLAQIKQGAAVVASFSYDALGRRIAKTAAGVTTQYLYDGVNAVQETQGSTVNPILTGLGIDERYARNEGGTRSYFLTDALGSTVALANVGGMLIQ